MPITTWGNVEINVKFIYSNPGAQTQQNLRISRVYPAKKNDDGFWHVLVAIQSCVQ